MVQLSSLPYIMHPGVPVFRTAKNCAGYFSPGTTVMSGHGLEMPCPGSAGSGRAVSRMHIPSWE